MKVADFTFDTPRPANTPPLVQQNTPQTLESLESRLRRAAQEYGHHTAMADSQGSMNHTAFYTATGAVARFIAQRNFAPETPVAVLCGRNRFYGVAALGILRAAAVYTPLDPGLPLSRLALMLQESAAPLLITDSAHVDAAQRLQVLVPSLRLLLCLDAETFEEAIEKPGDGMSLDLWDVVTAEHEDGSWKSYFDGTRLPAEALHGMADNVLEKVEAVLTPGARVLDIGSGGGVVARKLISRCAHYTAVDLSRNDLERLSVLSNGGIETHHMEALDIALLSTDPAKHYDLICLNSVVESFPGYNYMRAVLFQAMERLKDHGRVFVGMVWDTEKKEQYRQDILAYAHEHDSVGWSVTAFDAGRELFVPRAFFEDWAASSPVPVRVEFFPTRNPLPELADYRYDVVISKIPGNGADQAHKNTNISRFGTKDLDFSPYTAPPIPLNSAAYIIFTSGSTGMPKGVVVEHGSLLHMSQDILNLVQSHVLPRHPHMANRPWRCILLSSCAFDASLQLLITAPLHGHSLYWADDELRKNPPALHKIMESNAIDISDGTPSLFALLQSYWEESGQCTAVRAFILGGEALRRDLLERFYHIPSHARVCLANAYGPTECCVNTTLHPLDITNYNLYAQPPLGVPLTSAGAKPGFRLCDAQGHPLPEAIPGELWISGARLARGYLHDAEKTRQLFVEQDGQRWYRTGDMCRQSDGLLFFMGRMDQQVKVAGNRVELGDVEAALCAAPGIRQAAVKAEDFSSDGTLALGAWIVPQRELEDSADFIKSVRAWMENRLPAYARPVHYCLLHALPLNASGKVDHKSLPRMPLTATSNNSSGEARPPRTATETRLAGLWANVLGHPVNDTRSDFFALGGHSILAIRLLSCMEKEFGHRLPLAELFRCPTLEALAATVDNHIAKEGYCPILELASTPGTMPVFLFHPVGGSVYCYRELAEHLANFATVYAVEPPGFSVSTPHMYSVEDMATRYLEEILRHVNPATLAHPDGVVFAGWSFGGLLAYETARRYRSQNGKVRHVILLDSEAQRGADSLHDDENTMLEAMFEGLVPLDKTLLRTLTGNDKLDYLMDLGIAHQRLPSGFTREHMRRLLLTYHYNALAGARYTPKPSGEHGLLIRARQISASSGIVDRTPYLGWEHVLGGGLTLQWVDASHETLLVGNHAREVAQRMLMATQKPSTAPSPAAEATPAAATLPAPKANGWRIFALPYGGGSAQAYRPLKNFLRPDIEFCPVELPGRYGRANEALLTSLESMADDIFAQIRNRLDLPYAFFGHSMGAALAWLCCARVQEAGLPMPKVIFLSSPPVNTFVLPQSATLTPALQGKAAEPNPIHTLSGSAFFQRMSQLGGLPQEVLAHKDICDYFEPILRADMLAVETWRPTDSLHIPVATEMLFGTDEHDAQILNVVRQHWENCTGQAVTVHLFAGGHFYLYTHWQDVGLLLNTRLTTPACSGN